MKKNYFLNHRTIFASLFLKKTVLLCFSLFVFNNLFADEVTDTIPDINDPFALQCPGEPLVFSTGPFDCTAAFVMPFPIITESCAAYELFFDIYREVKVPTQDFGGYNLDTLSVYSGSPGDYISNVFTKTVFIRYYAVTNGDTTSIDCPIVIYDGINPVAVCDNDLHISIGGAGYERLYAEDVDEGSHDNCTDVRIEIRREGGEWGEYIDFDCEDIQTNVIIELRVWDDANRNEIWGDWYGNDSHDTDLLWDDSNDNVKICEVEVGIEDGINPTCIAPLGTSIICDNSLFPSIDWNNFDQLNEMFGVAIADDNCNATTEQISININISDCSFGTVVRVFSAVDDWGTESANLCEQLITIPEVHDFEIKFPKDVDIQCGEAILDTLVYNTSGCDLFTVNVTNEQYAILQPGVCVEILHTYKVINWCEWDGETDPIVISRNEDCDDDDGDEDIWVIVRTTENGGNLSYTTFLDRDNEETNFNPYIGHNRCGTGQGAALNGHWSNSNNNPELTSVGYWQYTQIIKISDDEVPTLEVADYNLFCVQSEDSTASVAITFTVTENWSLDMMYLTSRIDLGADGENDGTATLIEDETAATSTSRTFSVSGAYPIGAHIFELSVTDYCHNTVRLDIPFEIIACGPFDVNIIGGTIQTEESVGIEAVEVTLGGSGMQNDLTGNDGYYEFSEIGDGLGADYSITPYLNIQAPGSISSYDLILVAKHILGIQLLDSPYKIIAADVNNSGTVSSMDLMVLRELVLGTYDEFPDNTFWRFVDADYVFPDPTNPWLDIFPEIKNIITENYTELDHNFIGVAIGDVNNSAIPNFETTDDDRNRDDLFTLTTENIKIKAGSDYKIDFTSADITEIEGYQFTLLFDKTVLRFESIEYGISGAENFGLNYVSEGMITISWDKYIGMPSQGNNLNKVLFSIHFHANSHGILSDVLSLSSRVTKAEAYGNDGVLDVAINFVSKNIIKTDFEVYQNIPNPFKGETRISFNLPEDAKVNIMIQDVNGRVIKLIEKSGVRGFNSVMFDANTLGVVGVFYYTVSTEEYVGTKRMVVVE